ncbi:MAG: T9SS type A sorting domain-containing protein [Saprospiraceae bacterium]|nr:T9SS type A sorting domain-containing protein [Saprospiraceae bacterium]
MSQLLKVFISLLLFHPVSKSQTIEFLDINDVKASVSADGRLFRNGFEVPKGSKRNTINESNLWMAAYNGNRDLKVAANTFRNQSDFFYGPIATDYSDSSYINKYNRTWKINQSDITNHIRNYMTPGYQTPNSIKDWPGNGNEANGEAKLLAPFEDLNRNKIYEPEKGEYPIVCGDQAIYFIFNDSKSIHTNSNGEPLYFEIHGTVYGFKNSLDTALNQTVFVKFIIYNRSKSYYEDFCLGLLTDYKIGNSSDDYIGYDTGNQLAYSYNSSDTDLVYGVNPPVQGCLIFDSPVHTFMYYNSNNGNFPPATGTPSSAVEYYRFLNASWRDATHLTRGGSGYNPSSQDSSKYAFTGNPFDTGWTQLGLSPKNIEHSLLAKKDDFLEANGITSADFAFTYARDFKGNHLSAIKLLKEYASKVNWFYNDNLRSCAHPWVKTNQLDATAQLYIEPNPFTSKIKIRSTNFPSNQKVKIEVFNYLGQTMWSEQKAQLDENEIDLSILPPGIYFISFSYLNSRISKVIYKTQN